MNKSAQFNLISHFLEIRKRVLYCLITFSVVALPCIVFAKELFETTTAWFFFPLPRDYTFIATEVTSTFVIPLKLALFATLFCVAPFILYQGWAFITPGLYAHEKRHLRISFIASVGLFYVGAAFAYFLVCPLALQFFIGQAPSNVHVMTDLSHYLNFIIKMILSFGIGFQVPIIIFLSLQAGICSIQSLKNKRRYIIVLAFVLGMLLTPPDVISQVLLALPMIALFELGIISYTLFGHSTCTKLRNTNAP
ncbi:MAG TPA: twin-arginine translocase subunit TatC [Gammaproteobacteria bacterium]|nr:twin-arginine translocase subunit TatC [Gammaproteobacteria bacterium]